MRRETLSAVLEYLVFLFICVMMGAHAIAR